MHSVFFSRNSYTIISSAHTLFNMYLIGMLYLLCFITVHPFTSSPVCFIDYKLCNRYLGDADSLYDVITR